MFRIEFSLSSEKKNTNKLYNGRFLFDSSENELFFKFGYLKKNVSAAIS